MKKIISINKIKTMTEMNVLREARYHHKMTHRMAKALVEGKVTSEVLKYAEMLVQIEFPQEEKKTKGGENI